MLSSAARPANDRSVGVWRVIVLKYFVIRLKHDIITRKGDENMKCPMCGSRKTAPILYGMPVMDEDTIKHLNDGELYLGGCCLNDNDPGYHCFGCDINFGTRPVMPGDPDAKDIRDMVTGGRFNMRSGADSRLRRSPKT